MKRKIKSKYKIATTAIHKTGDISRKSSDICVVFEEDDENYYGNWVIGFGFVEVAFPKTTTRDLNKQEIDEYHGIPIFLNKNCISVINIIGEDFNKAVELINKTSGKKYTGTLFAPIKVGQSIIMHQDNNALFQSSVIKNITDNVIKTKNSVYKIIYI